MGQRSELHWPNGVCHPWDIVVYNVEPTLAQRGNDIRVGENLFKPAISAFLKVVLEKDDQDLKNMPLSKK